MDDLTLSSNGLQVCQDEYLVSQVLELLFHGKDDQGRAHTIDTACKEVAWPAAPGIAGSKRARWTHTRRR
ncbi:MAG: hypothetical protein HS126_21670 [Anaerolineales bacterium]|nr:hypothetical protein [Anaerolineales bacterium]